MWLVWGVRGRWGYRRGVWLIVRVSAIGGGSVCDGSRGTLCVCGLCTGMPPLPRLACEGLLVVGLPLASLIPASPVAVGFTNFVGPFGGLQSVTARVVGNFTL